MNNIVDKFDFFWNRSFGRKQTISNNLLRVGCLARYITGTENRIILNSIPKSGTHLLSKIIKESGIIKNSGFFFADIHHGRIIRDYRDSELYFKYISKNCYLGSHMPYSPENESMVNKYGYKMILMVRDPRDVLVSQLHHCLNRSTNRAHKYIIERSTREEQLKSFLYGFEPSNDMPVVESIAKYYERYEKWISNGALVVRFEDLVGNKGGGKDSVQLETVKRIMNYISDSPIEEDVINEKARLISDNVFDTKSNTFRSGQIGGWSNGLTNSEKTLISSNLTGVGSGFGY